MKYAEDTEQPDLEFQSGDIVTFNAYIDRVITCKVLKCYDHFSLFREDNRKSYKLEGISAPCITRCTGLSIRESKYFKKPEYY
jgi:hypothetical protein